MRPPTLPVIRLALFTLAGFSALPAAEAADRPPTVAIRAALEDGNTVKAARLADRALLDAPSDEVAELRYLRLKAYVLDLTPDGGKLYRQVTGDNKDDSMEDYREYLDGLEAEVRAEGITALPVLVDNLGRGGSLDTLLSLGLLADMAAEDSPMPWRDPAGGGLPSPVAAARDAVRAGVASCTAVEAETGDQPIYAIEDQRVREPYVEAVYATETGMDFLARADPAAWGEEFARALTCRGAADTLVSDRVRLRALHAHLVGPLREELPRAEPDSAKVEILVLLGRLGDCDDVAAVSAQAGAGEDPVRNAATVALERLRKRHGCED